MTNPVTATVTLPSGTRVVVDPWAANPVVEGYRALNPATYAAALLDGPPPTLFESGDLPPFTTSGVDVQVLPLLPFAVRHHAATTESRGTILQLVEDFGKDASGSVDSEGLSAYLLRVSDWLMGRHVQRPASPTAETDATDPNSPVYQSIFGAQEAAQAARNAPALAAARAFQDQRTRTGAYADGIGRAVR